MITRWDGRCSICTASLPKGTDVHYDAEAKTVQCWECFENPKPGPEAFELAERLGFIEYRQDMAVDGLLSRMFRTDRKLTAIGNEPKTRGKQDSLWGMREGETYTDGDYMG